MLLLFVWWSTALTDWKRITDKCYHVDSYNDAMYWFPSGDDVYFCDCIDTILSLKNLQTEFLEWKGLALFIIYSVLEEVCDFMGLYNYNEKKGQTEKSQVPASRPLAREIKHDRARQATPEKMGRWVLRATTYEKCDTQVTHCLCITLENSNASGGGKIHSALIRGSKLSSQVVHCQPTLHWISGSR